MKQGCKPGRGRTIKYHDELHRKHRDASHKYYHEHPDKPREYVTKNREKLNVYTKNYHRSQLVLLKDGRWVKVNNKPPRPNDICSVCGRQTTMLHYHHWNDTTPEAGIWVCRGCHHGCEFIDSGYHGEYLKLRSMAMLAVDIKLSLYTASNT